MHALNDFNYRRGSRSKRQSSETSTSGCFPRFRSRFPSTASSLPFTLARRFLRRSRTKSNVTTPSITCQPPPRLYDRPLLNPERKRFGGRAVSGSDGDHGPNEVDSGYWEVASQYDMTQQETTKERPFCVSFFQQVSQPNHRSSDKTETGCSLHKFTQSLDTPVPTPNEATLDGMAIPIEGQSEAAKRAQQVPRLGNQSMLYASYNWQTITAGRSSMRGLDGVDDFFKRGVWKRWGIVFDVDGVER